jgi:hypothetical protein
VRQPEFCAITGSERFAFAWLGGGSDLRYLSGTAVVGAPKLPSHYGLGDAGESQSIAVF